MGASRFLQHASEKCPPGPGVLSPSVHLLQPGAGSDPPVLKSSQSFMDTVTSSFTRTSSMVEQRTLGSVLVLRLKPSLCFHRWAVWLEVQPSVWPQHKEKRDKMTPPALDQPPLGGGGGSSHLIRHRGRGGGSIFHRKLEMRMDGDDQAGMGGGRGGKVTDFKSALWPLTGATEAQYERAEQRGQRCPPPNQLTFLQAL